MNNFLRMKGVAVGRSHGGRMISVRLLAPAAITEQIPAYASTVSW